jgi:hypothetical protein
MTEGINVAEAKQIAERVVRAIEQAYNDTEQSVPRAFCAEASDAAYGAAIDALLALVQPAVSEEAPHLETIREKLIRAGAKLPMENKGTIESAMAGGLSIALCIVEAEIDAARAQSSSKGDESVTHLCSEPRDCPTCVRAGRDLRGTKEAGHE